jgi:hypothetical protein
VHHVDPRLFPVYCSTEWAIDVVAEYQLGAPEATAADVPPIELTME